MLNEQEKQGVLSVGFLAAFADGAKDDTERATLKSVADAIGSEGDISVPTILTNVMLKKVTLAQIPEMLTSPESRTFAYEIAVQVCDADGLRNENENQFLTELAAALQVTSDERKDLEEAPDSMAVAPIAAAGNLPTPTEPAEIAKDIDAMIRNYAILCGALELLPQSVAGMAVIPMQMKMVYRIGAEQGFTLDKGHIKDFIATLGVGLTSQYVESIGRKILGGFLKKHTKKIAGKWGQTAGKVATSSASVVMTFGTTWALGHVAQQYYAGGRKMDGATLRAAFQSSLGKGREISNQYLPAMQEQASKLDMQSVMQMVRGNSMP